MAVLALAAGCSSGDDGESSASASNTDTSASTSTNAAAGRSGAKAPKVRLQLRVAKAMSSGLTYRKRVSVKPGDRLVLTARVQNTRQAKDALLALSVDMGPKRVLELTGGNEGAKPSATAQIRSSTATPITLATLKYRCTVGAGTFCPLERATQRDGRARVVTKTPPQGVQIVFTTDVRPPPGK